MYNVCNVLKTDSLIWQLNCIFKVTKLWSADGGNEASTTRRSNANPESLSTMDKNAVGMTMENSQLKKLLAEVSFYLNVKYDAQESIKNNNWLVLTWKTKKKLFN